MSEKTLRVHLELADGEVDHATVELGTEGTGRDTWVNAHGHAR